MASLPACSPATGSQQTVLTLDSTGHATTITDPAGEASHYTYSNGLMTSFQTPAGYLHQFSYDALGNLLTDQDPTGATQTLARTIASAGPNDVTGLDWSVALTSGAGHTTNHAVTTSTTGLVTQTTTSPSGATGSYARSSMDGRAQTLPDGTVTTTTMAPDPRFGMIAPYPGNEVVQTPSGLMKTTTRTRTSIGSQATPSAINETDTVNGHSSATAYASTGTPSVTYTSSQGRQLQEVLDSQGRVVQVSYPGSLLASTALNYAASGGRLSSVASTSGTTTRTTSMTYDSPGLAGYLATTTDPMGNVTTFQTRDSVGRPTNVLLPDHPTNPNSQYSASYDLDGNTSSLTVPPSTTSSSTHLFSSNNLDLLGTYDPPSALATSYTYNPDRQITSIQVPAGASSFQTTTYNYDSFGRLASVVDQSSASTRQFSYDAADRLSTATRAGSTLTNSYDGFLKTQTQWSGSVSGTVAWAYDNFFRVAGRTVNGGSEADYSYDKDNLFIGTSAPVSFTATRDYTHYYGLVTGTVLGTVSDSTGYSGFGELTTYSATTGSATLYSLSNVIRDANGRISSMTETTNGTTHAWSFLYDSRGRLSSATKDQTTNQYLYDPNGNRTTFNGTWTYDAQDRLTSAPNLAFTYVNDGTAATKVVSGTGTYSYTYDLSGVLLSVGLPTSGSSVAYTIDGLNRRIGRTLSVAGSPSVSQGFLYDDQLRVAAELNSSGAVTSVFVYGTKPNVPDYMYRGGTAYRIISDWRGSVRLVVKSTTVVQQLDYDEFGNVLPSSFDTTCAAGTQCFPFQPFGFAGGLQDRDTGLVRFGARDYDPQVGRWVSKDPIRFRGGLNLYEYAGDDPINTIDAYGYFGISFGFNYGGDIGTGPNAVGGYLEIGLFWNQETGNFEPYLTTASNLGNVGIGADLGGGFNVTFLPDASNFYGSGRELSVGIEAAWGLNGQAEFDTNGHLVGGSLGVSGGVGTSSRMRRTRPG